MGLTNWRETTVAMLSEKVGPVAALLVDDALRKMRDVGSEMPASQFLKFLRTLQGLLPVEIDRKAVCDDIRDAVFRQNGFTALP